ncbi:MAG TPA: response regulator [Bryobacteraceae bacterium]|jgi:CheY-like chemotaxis protein
MTRILVVEDDEANQEIVTRVLRREGYEVILAGDGLTGVALALAEVPDLILMDLSLPELDGWEATRRIRANPVTATIPIIALTAHAFAEEVQQALQAGCSRYETKPLVYRRLIKKIKDLLNPPTVAV